MHLLVDSTGVKLSGPGEWLVEKHGTQRRRAWRKLHLAIDAKTGTIVASTLTSKEVDDAAELGPLLDQIDEPLAAVIADGAYDQDRVYDDVAEHSAEAAVIVPPRATAVLSASAETDPTQRDCHIQAIAEQGRMSWQQTSGYNARAGAEGAMSRYKRIIGDTLRSHSRPAQEVETRIAVTVLNRMLDLGRPNPSRRLKINEPGKKSVLVGPPARAAGGAFPASCPGTEQNHINQTISLARRPVIHVQRVAALRDLISAAMIQLLVVIFLSAAQLAPNADRTEMAALNIERDAFHPEWRYTIAPRET